MADPTVMRLLAAIAEGEPCDRVPDVAGIDPDTRSQLVGIAYRAGSERVKHFETSGQLFF